MKPSATSQFESNWIRCFKTMCGFINVFIRDYLRGSHCLFIIYYNKMLYPKNVTLRSAGDHNKHVLAIIDRLEEYKTGFLDIFLKL